MAIEIEHSIRELIQAKLSIPQTNIELRQGSGSIVILIDGIGIGSFVTENKLSHMMLRRLEGSIKRSFDVSATIIILTGRLLSDVEAGIRLILAARFTEVFSDVVASVHMQDQVSVWLVPTVANERIDTNKLKEVEAACQSFLELAGLRLESAVIAGQIYPELTGPVILSTIRTGQPISVQDLFDVLVARGFSPIEKHRLENLLDDLRKKGFLQLMRQEEKSEKWLYALTSLGLASLPPSLGRESGDIKRALALARRNW